MPCLDAWGRHLLYLLKEGAMWAHCPIFQLLQRENGNRGMALPFFLPILGGWMLLARFSLLKTRERAAEAAPVPGPPRENHGHATQDRSPAAWHWDRALAGGLVPAAEAAPLRSRTPIASAHHSRAASKVIELRWSKAGFPAGEMGSSWLTLDYSLRIIVPRSVLDQFIVRNEVGKITGASQLELISPAGNPFPGSFWQETRLAG